MASGFMQAQRVEERPLSKLYQVYWILESNNLRWESIDKVNCSLDRKILKVFGREACIVKVPPLFIESPIFLSARPFCCGV